MLEVDAVHLPGDLSAPAVHRWRVGSIVRPSFEVAAREIAIMWRGRAVGGYGVLLAVAAWLAPILPSLRRGVVALSPFADTIALALALSEVAIPLVGLLCGAEMIAGEGEDGTLIPLTTLPLSRSAIFTGKLLGRSILLALAYVIAFGSSALGVLWAQGAAGFADYVAVAGSGLALLLTSCAIGAALGAVARGRVPAFGAALVAWLVMVFALDALVLSAIVMIAPAPPRNEASHGYGEMAAQMEMMKLHEMDDDPQSSDEHAERGGGSLKPWLMALDPVDLSRLTAIAASPLLRQRAASAFTQPLAIAPFVAAWMGWLAGAVAIGIRRFSRADLR